MQIGLGGALHESRPVALLREVVNAESEIFPSIRTVVGYDVDLLIGAGLVKKPSFRPLRSNPGLAPNFREAVEELVKAHILDVLTVVGT